MNAAVAGRPRWRKWSEQTRKARRDYTYIPLVLSSRGQTYVAVITGTDERYVFERLFAHSLVDRRTRSRGGRGGSARARIPLTYDELYEIQHWPDERRTRLYIHVSGGTAHPVDSSEAHRLART